MQWRRSLSLQASLSLLDEVKQVVEVPAKVEAAVKAKVRVCRAVEGGRTRVYSECWAREISSGARLQGLYAARVRLQGLGCKG